MILRGAGLGKILSPEETLLLGRDRNCCQVPLISSDHPQHISRRHLELKILPNGQVIIRDLRSANGSYLDGRRLGLEETVWETGTLEIGTSGEFRFQLEKIPRGESDTVTRQLRDNVEGAKRRRRRFLNVRKPCKREDLDRFFTGLKCLPQGDGRLFYLSLVGLTPEFVSSADPASLQVVAGNLGLPGNSTAEHFLAFLEGVI